MRKENQLHAITHITPEQATGYTQVNDNQWSVYFYLLSNSDYNSIDKEDHRFIYRSDINITRLSEKLNFTRQTYYNILKALHKRKLIDNNNSDYILLPLPKLYAEISKELMGQLLSYYNQFGIDLLRTYLFFVAVDKKYGKSKPITIRNIVKCLGHSTGRPEYYKNISACIDILSYWKLINFHTEWVEDTQIGKYMTYIIHEVASYSPILNERFEDYSGLLAAGGLTEDEEKIIARDMGIEL